MPPPPVDDMPIREETPVNPQPAMKKVTIDKSKILSGGGEETKAKEVDQDRINAILARVQRQTQKKESFEDKKEEVKQPEPAEVKPESKPDPEPVAKEAPAAEEKAEAKESTEVSDEDAI